MLCLCLEHERRNKSMTAKDSNWMEYLLCHDIMFPRDILFFPCLTNEFKNESSFLVWLYCFVWHQYLQSWNPFHSQVTWSQAEGQESHASCLQETCQLKLSGSKMVSLLTNHSGQRHPLPTLLPSSLSHEFPVHTMETTLVRLKTLQPSLPSLPPWLSRVSL